MLHLANSFHAWLRSSLSAIRTTKTDGPIYIDLEKSREINRAIKADREEWIRLRDRYITEQILRELGYEALVTTHYEEYMLDAKGQQVNAVYSMCGLKKSTHFI